MKQSMLHGKSTKNTHVYFCADENAAVTTLYVQRASLPTIPPKEIILSLEFMENTDADNAEVSDGTK